MRRLTMNLVLEVELPDGDDHALAPLICWGLTALTEVPEFRDGAVAPGDQYTLAGGTWPCCGTPLPSMLVMVDYKLEGEQAPQVPPDAITPPGTSTVH